MTRLVECDICKTIVRGKDPSVEVRVKECNGSSSSAYDRVNHLCGPCWHKQLWMKK